MTKAAVRRPAESRKTEVREVPARGGDFRFVVTASGISFLLAVLVAFGPMFAPYDPSLTEPGNALSGPTAGHVLGTDHLGRDVLSRMLYGARLSVGLSAAATVVSGVVGISLGLIAGRVGGFFEALVNRTVDTFIALPSILVGLVLAAILSPGMTALLVAIALTAWMPFARLAYALTVKISTREYVEAAVAIGVREKDILVRHVLPAAAGPLVALACLQFAYVLLAIAGLSFLGLGAQPPTAEWGAMLAESRPYMERSPSLVFVPAAAIVGVTLSVTVLGRVLSRRWALPSA